MISQLWVRIPHTMGTGLILFVCLYWCFLIEDASAFACQSLIHRRHSMGHELNVFPSLASGGAETRRAFVVVSASWMSLLLIPTLTTRADTGAQVRGIEVTPFNSLSFQYRGRDFAGLEASDLNEPSIPYKDFIERLQAGEVALVEFMAPNGDVAYVTFKSKPGQDESAVAPLLPTPIRIGVGFPIEQPDGYSSPAFAIRAVKNAGVPYKFVVPALSAYNNK